MNYNESLTEKLKVQHLALPHLITGVTANHLLWPPLAGKWSIHDNIAHLARYQQLFTDRIDQILFSDIPVFEPYKADVDPGFAAWRRREHGVLIDVIFADRIKIVDRLTALSTADLERKGRHSNYGEMDIPGWTEFFLLHEAHHLFTIFKLSRNQEFRRI
jgi:hypothetical protein